MNLVVETIYDMTLSDLYIDGVDTGCRGIQGGYRGDRDGNGNGGTNFIEICKFFIVKTIEAIVQVSVGLPFAALLSLVDDFCLSLNKSAAKEFNPKS